MSGRTGWPVPPRWTVCGCWLCEAPAASPHPNPGRSTILVYGWALPALPVVLPYTFAAGQSYAVGEVVAGFKFIMTTDAAGARTGEWTVLEGGVSYAQIQFGHRIMYVS